MKKLAIFQNIVNGFFMFSSSFHNPLQSCSSGYHQLKFCVVEDQFILLLLHQFNENSSFFLRKKKSKVHKKENNRDCRLLFFTKNLWHDT